MNKLQKNISGQSGEYAVASELSRLGLIATTFTRNMPDFDILATNSNKMIKIQVKTIYTGDWSLDVKRFLKLDDASFKEGIQKVLGKKENNDVDFIIFVKMAETRINDEFYILPYNEFLEIIYKNYTSFLERVNSKRPKNLFTTHTGLKPKDISVYKDKWDLIVNFN